MEKGNQHKYLSRISLRVIILTKVKRFICQNKLKLFLNIKYEIILTLIILLN